MAVIIGNDNNNSLLGTSDADSISGLGGDDRINALTRPPAGGFDVVDGGTGADTLIVNASSETLAVQLLYGGAPSYSVQSGSGNFRVDAYNMERVEFAGGAGNDHINTGERGGTVNGGGGIDHWLAGLGALFGDVVFELGVTTAIAEAGLTSVLNIDRITLATGAGDDVLTGGSHADTINGGDGNDIINARGRSDVIGGFDVVDGGEDFDTLVVDATSETGAVQLSAGGAPSFSVSSASNAIRVDAYNIEAVRFTGGAGGDTINTGGASGTVSGGDGIDFWLADLSAVTSDIVYDLATTTAIAAAGLTSIQGIERITLTTGAGNDRITGGSQADTIGTGAGDDRINAKTRDPSGGFDVVDGGRGTDLLIVNAASESKAVALLSGGAPSFSLSSESNRFRVDAYSIELIDITSGAGNDYIDTADRAVEVHGGAGIDHWLANYAAVTDDIVYDVSNTGAIAAAGLAAITGIERITFTSGSGDDRITGGSQADTISTGAGDDTINAKTRNPSAGFDTVDGGRGTDLLIVNAASEKKAVALLSGGAPSFSLSSESNRFRVDAYSIELIDITSGAGNDYIDTADRAVEVHGGAGIDHWLANYAAVTDDIVYDVSTTEAIAAAGLSAISGIERITFTSGSGDDVVTGGSQADAIGTGAGDDRINAKTRDPSGGFDTVDGGSGVDTLIINAAADTAGVQLSAGGAPSFSLSSVSGVFRVDAYDVERVEVTGGNGNDTLNTGAGGVKIDGRGGIDHWIADLSGIGADLTFVLGTTSAITAAGVASIARVERVSLTMGGGDDVITGGSHADSISAGSGNDTVNLMDRAIAGSAFDVADGGTGSDRLVIDASGETLSVHLSSGGAPSFSLASDSGKFRADAYNFESVDFRSGSGADRASGGIQGDRLFMGAGDDQAAGNSGNDTIRGEAGNDVIRGGRGADTLTGGSESDLFVYDRVSESRVSTAEVDTITDFGSTIDRIDLAAIDADGFGNNGNQAFIFIGAGAFSSVRGELRAAAGRIEADLNGDGVADFRIILSNGATAVEADFLL